MGDKRSRLKLPPKEYALLRYAVLSRDGWKCKVCKRREDLHIHHIIFRRSVLINQETGEVLHGDDASWNLMAVCNDCHEAIHDRYVIIHPVSGWFVNADKGVKLEYINGWKPKRRVR